MVFTTARGTTFICECGFNTFIAPNGIKVTQGYVTCSNKNSGHGWGGIMTKNRWDNIKAGKTSN